LGVACCVTIIGIPLGLQYFKFIKLAFAPAGKVVVTKYSRHPVLNTLWFIFGGLEMMILYWFLGVVLTITIIGRPLARQLFKIAKFNYAPFGCEILKEGEYSKEGNLIYDYELLARRIAANPNVVVGTSVNGEPKTAANYIRENGEEVGKIVDIEQKADKIKSIIVMAFIFVFGILFGVVSYKIFDLIFYGIGNMVLTIAFGIIVATIVSAFLSKPKKETLKFYETKMRWLMEYYPMGSEEKAISGIGTTLAQYISLVYVIKNN
jgi:uncharacterized membrane protein YccF (DUF307 family)